MKLLLAIALGGAIGAVGRYLVSSQMAHWFGTGFPLGTLTVNVVGSFAMGVIVELSALAWSPSPALKVFIVTGLLGAFTTFSTFSLDVAVLVQRDATMVAALYVILSVILSISGLFAGLAVARSFVS